MINSFNGNSRNLEMKERSNLESVKQYFLFKIIRHVQIMIELREKELDHRNIA
jgi:hypothetical protein